VGGFGRTTTEALQEASRGPPGASSQPRWECPPRSVRLARDRDGVRRGSPSLPLPQAPAERGLRLGDQAAAAGVRPPPGVPDPGGLRPQDQGDPRAPADPPGPQTAARNDRPLSFTSVPSELMHVCALSCLGYSERCPPPPPPTTGRREGRGGEGRPALGVLTAAAVPGGGARGGGLRDREGRRRGGPRRPQGPGPPLPFDLVVGVWLWVSGPDRP